MAQGKEHIPTEETRKLVEELAGYGLPMSNIGALCGEGIGRDLVAQYYSVEIERGKAKANSKVGRTLFQKAMEGDTTSAIWWSKTQMGWKETNVTEHAGSLEIKEIRNVIVDPAATLLDK